MIDYAPQYLHGPPVPLTALDKDALRYMRSQFGFETSSERADALFGFLEGHDWLELGKWSPFNQCVVFCERYTEDYD